MIDCGHTMTWSHVLISSREVIFFIWSHVMIISFCALPFSQFGGSPYRTCCLNSLCDYLPSSKLQQCRLVIISYCCSWEVRFAKKALCLPRLHCIGEACNYILFFWKKPTDGCQATNLFRFVEKGYCHLVGGFQFKLSPIIKVRWWLKKSEPCDKRHRNLGYC